MVDGASGAPGAQDRVDLLLGVADTWLERLHDMLEDHASAGALRWRPQQPPVADEGAHHGLGLLVGVAVVLGLLRRGCGAGDLLNTEASRVKPSAAEVTSPPVSSRCSAVPTARWSSPVASISSDGVRAPRISAATTRSRSGSASSPTSASGVTFGHGTGALRGTARASHGASGGPPRCTS